jgi:hypothetical protein
MWPASRFLSVARKLAVASCALGLGLAGLKAFTVDDLLTDSKMDAKRFANHFDDFEFELHREVLTPESFIQAKAGDCQDYAVLADYVLTKKHFTTRLIRVVMVGMIAHDVCFVAEARGYLDYNNRLYVKNLQRSGPTLREIADRVADSFEGDWTTVSEYTYNYDEDVKHIGLTVVKTDPPDQDPDSGRYNKEKK